MYLFFFLLGQASQQFVEPLQTLRFTPRAGRRSMESRVKKKSRRESTTPLFASPNPMPLLHFCHPQGHLENQATNCPSGRGSVFVVLLLTAAVYGLLRLPSRCPYPTTKGYANDRQACHLPAVLREFIRAGVSGFGLNLELLGVAQDGGTTAHANAILCCCFSRLPLCTQHIHIKMPCRALDMFKGCSTSVSHGTGLTVQPLTLTRDKVSSFLHIQRHLESDRRVEPSEHVGKLGLARG